MSKCLGIFRYLLAADCTCIFERSPVSYTFSSQLLREQIARQRVGTTDEGMNTRHFPAHEREDLVRQLETSREEVDIVMSS